MLVMPAKELVGMVKEMMMKMAMSSRSPFMVMDDKGGEEED